VTSMHHSAEVHGRRTGAGSRVAGTLSTLISVGVYFLLFVVPLMRSEDFGWTHFRNYFAFDQYSYLAIARNVQTGDYSAVEPFSQTGANDYPRLYYVFLGSVARILGADLVGTWQVVGIVFQLIMVAAVSALCIRLTRLPWAGTLGIMPFLIGTFAWLRTDSWFHSLESHGVLWSAFGVLFTVNGESAALCLAIVSMCVVMFAVQPGTVRGRTLRIAAAFAVVGLLANIQTYTFLSSVYLLAFAFASYGLAIKGSRIRIGVSVAVTIFVLVLGPTLSNTAGPLVTLVSGAAGALPGLLEVLKRHRSTFLISAAALMVFAMPTIAGTVLGRVSGDPFLTYREASSSNLGVPPGVGVASAAIPLLLLVIILVGGLIARHVLWVSYSSGALIAWVITSTNDLWGANQEPYRFWIGCFTIISATAVPLCASVIVHSWRQWRSRAQDPDPHIRRPVVLALCSALAIVTLTVASLPDYIRFAGYVRAQGTSVMLDSQMETAARITGDLGTSPGSAGPVAQTLLMFDPCIDPLKLKYATGLPIAFYNLGLAWPSAEPQIRELLVERNQGRLDSARAASAGVTHVITTSACTADWSTTIEGSVVERASYDTVDGPAELSLWRLDG
jgi:hypothetical protein